MRTYYRGQLNSARRGTEHHASRDIGRVAEDIEDEPVLTNDGAEARATVDADAKRVPLLAELSRCSTSRRKASAARAIRTAPSLGFTPPRSIPTRHSVVEPIVVTFDAVGRNDLLHLLDGAPDARRGPPWRAGGLRRHCVLDRWPEDVELRRVEADEAAADVGDVDANAHVQVGRAVQDNAREANAS